MRLILLAALSSLAPVSAVAQSPSAPLELKAERTPTAARHAGVYHVSTGTWTRTGGAVAAFGPDVIYSNTAPSGYFSSVAGPGSFVPGARIYGEGGIPGLTNGQPFATGPNRDSYTVNGFQIGYCDLGLPGSSGWDIRFYSSFTPCTVPTFPDETLQLTGLPANGSCWVIDIDLSGGGEFCLATDGGPANPGWQDDPDLDSFSWSYSYAGTSTAPTSDAGFLIAGNPAFTDLNHVTGGLPLDGSNTYFGAPSLCPGVGTGYLAQDLFLLEDPGGQYTNCYFFGGYSSGGSCAGMPTPYAEFHMQICADTAPCGPACLCSVYCNSNPNSTGVEGTIEAYGSAVAADDDVRLEASRLPADAFGYFLVSETQGLVTNPAGSQGNLCVLGTIGRFVGPGQVKDSGATGRITLDTNLGEWSLMALPSPSGPYPATTGLTSNFQLWHRDSLGGMPTSNFTNAISVTWL